jgi:hypothetical protein
MGKDSLSVSIWFEKLAAIKHQSHKALVPSFELNIE